MGVEYVGAFDSATNVQINDHYFEAPTKEFIGNVLDQNMNGHSRQLGQQTSRNGWQVP